MGRRHGFWVRTLELIKSHKISRMKFAEYIGVPYPSFKGWIHYNRIPNAITSCDIAESLGVTVEYLVRGDDEAAQKIRMKQVEQRKTVNARLQKQIDSLAKTATKLS